MRLEAVNNSAIMCVCHGRVTDLGNRIDKQEDTGRLAEVPVEEGKPDQLALQLLLMVAKLSP